MDRYRHRIAFAGCVRGECRIALTADKMSGILRILMADFMTGLVRTKNG